MPSPAPKSIVAPETQRNKDVYTFTPTAEVRQMTYYCLAASLLSPDRGKRGKGIKPVKKLNGGRLKD